MVTSPYPWLWSIANRHSPSQNLIHYRYLSWPIAGYKHLSPSPSAIRHVTKMNIPSASTSTPGAISDEVPTRLTSKMVEKLRA